VAPWGVGSRLDSYLSRFVGEHSRSEWQRLVEAGSVTVNGDLVKPAVRLARGDRIQVHPVASFALLEPDTSIKLDVLYEDAAMVVIDKPAGLVVHPAPGHQEGTLVHALLGRFPELRDPTGEQRPGIVHRLDKDTSGVMVAGKTLDAVAALQRSMQSGGSRKTYRLLVLGTIEEDAGTIDVPIGRDRVFRQRMAARVDGRPARTEFKVIERLPGYTFVDAVLATGRTHQLRVHFAYIGHPVAGDRVYGHGRPPPGLNRQFVHSHELMIASPATHRMMTFTAELPEDLQQTLTTLRTLAANGEHVAEQQAANSVSPPAAGDGEAGE
jgi:23S rRNA pseudouridine1911/1915/1917 synthase